MSNNAPISNLPSLQDVIDWLKQRPRTFGWDVMVFYDQAMTNQVLLQEYIERYEDAEMFFDPITDKIAITNNRWEYLYDHVLDAPSLSFENSVLGGGSVSLTMRILGGVHLTVDQSSTGVKGVSKLEVYDPLQAPKLLAELYLDEADGNVAKDGRVKLNLSNGTRFRVTVAGTAIEQQKGGEFYRQLFLGWPDEKKHLVLNIIQDFDSSNNLHPERFRMRVVPEPGANLKSSANYGKGAVMLMIANVGSEVGTTPDKEAEWVYPIPEGLSATMLLSNKVLLLNLIGTGLSREMPGTEYAVIPMEHGSYFSKIVSTQGTYPFNHKLDWAGLMGEADSLKFATYEMTMPLKDFPGGVRGLIEIVQKDLVFDLSWHVKSTSTSMICTIKPDFGLSSTFSIEFSINNQFEIVSTEDGGLATRWIRPDAWLGDAIFNPIQVPDSHKPYVNHFKSGFPVAVALELGALFSRSITNVLEIDDFRYHALLFRGEEVFKTRQSVLTGDFAMFGELETPFTRFSLSPAVDVIAAGSTLKLQALPAPTETLEWEVQVARGFQGAAGSIDKGVYQAPTADEIQGTYTMVRITASNSTHRSSALIRVAVRGVVVNPVVATAALNGGKVKISGAAIDAGELTWTVRSESGGKLVTEPLEGGGEFEPGDKFYQAGGVPTGKAISIDEVIATNPRTGLKHSAHIVVMEEERSGTVRMTRGEGLPADSIQLELVISGGNPAKGVVWTVAAGGGFITEEGVYTVDKSSPHAFAIVTGVLNLPDIGIMMSNFAILPVPLIDIDDILAAVS